MRTKLLSIVAALTLSTGIAMASAPATSSPKTSSTNSTKATTHRLTGTVTSVTASDLVVAHKYHGKEESSTFVLNSTTKTEGKLMKGDRATGADESASTATWPQ
jgi:hypothetical protein